MYVKDDEWGTKYPHFQKSEFTCPCCSSIGDGIASSLVELLETLRNEYGAIIITSGYRCPSYNKNVGGVSNSAHMKGQAADFVPASGITNNQDNRIAIVNEIKTLPNYHYAYCNVDGNYPNMGNAIHVDTILTSENDYKEGTWLIVNVPEGLYLLDENGNRKGLYEYGTDVIYLSNGYNMFDYEYYYIEINGDKNRGYMAKEFLSLKYKEEPTTSNTEPSNEATTNKNLFKMLIELLKELIQLLKGGK